jgi:hypothetical protein
MKTTQLGRYSHYFALIMAGMTIPRAGIAENVHQRPIEDFLSAQGARASFSPYEYIGWLSVADRLPNRLAVVDYAGITNKALELGLGTTFNGAITERPLGDGRAEVVVTLKTQNALIWVADLDGAFESSEFDCGNCQLLFGATGKEVKNKAAPALGKSFLQLVLKNTAIGAPLPDIFSAFITENSYQDGQELLAVSFHAEASGFLPNGEKGEVTIDQVGRVAMIGEGNVFQHEFDIERVDVKAVDLSGLH